MAMTEMNYPNSGGGGGNSFFFTSVPSNGRVECGFEPKYISFYIVSSNQMFLYSYNADSNPNIYTQYYANHMYGDITGNVGSGAIQAIDSTGFNIATSLLNSSTFVFGLAAA